jgi:hypothetical protein
LCQAPIWGPRSYFYYCQTAAGLFMWGTLSDEKMGLSFTTCCWSSQAQSLLSQIRDPPNLEGQVPVFISPRNRVTQLYPRHWVPFPSPPTTRRATLEVSEPASTRKKPPFFRSSLPFTHAPPSLPSLALFSHLFYFSALPPFRSPYSSSGTAHWVFPKHGWSWLLFIYPHSSSSLFVHKKAHFSSEILCFLFRLLVFREVAARFVAYCETRR